jgi:hypothetical protein
VSDANNTIKEVKTEPIRLAHKMGMPVRGAGQGGGGGANPVPWFKATPLKKHLMYCFHESASFNCETFLTWSFYTC